MTAKPEHEAFSIALLAGGYGRRLGQDKATAVVAGRPLLHWTAEAVGPLSDDVMVIHRIGQELGGAPEGIEWREVSDRRPDAGPLAGIEAALQASRHDVVVAVACDMPLVRPALVRAIAAACDGYDVAMPRLFEREQPLLAAYRRSCLAVVGELLAEGDGHIRAILPRLRSRRLERADLVAYDEDLVSFTNINYPEDLERLGALLSQRSGERAQAEE